MALTVKKDDAVRLLVALDFPKAGEFPDKKLSDKLNDAKVILEDPDADAKKITDKNLKKLFNQVVSELEKKGTVEIASASEPAPAKGGKATPAAAAPAKGKGGKEAPAKAAAGPKKVGVVQTIIDCLEGASKTKPVTKEEILKVLVKKFPEREEAAMKSTVNSQVPSGIRVEKKRECQKNEKGFWLDPVKGNATPARVGK